MIIIQLTIDMSGSAIRITRPKAEVSPMICQIVPLNMKSVESFPVAGCTLKHDVGSAPTTILLSEGFLPNVLAFYPQNACGVNKNRICAVKS